MKLPRGTAYKVVGTKNTTLAALLSELRLEKFSGYLRITVEVEKNLKDGYIVLKDGEIAAASYEGREKLNGARALEKIRTVSSMPGIIDVYKFSPFQLQITLEENKECCLTAEEEVRSAVQTPPAEPEPIPEQPKAAPAKVEIPKETPRLEIQIEKAEDKKIAEEIEKPAPKKITEEPEIETPKPKIEAPEAAGETEEEKENRLKNERLKLLKKYGLSEPKEEFVEAVVSKFYMPADYEIATKAKELKKEMIKRIRAIKDIENVDIYVSTARGEDIVEFGIDVYVKPLTEKVKKEIEKLIDETLKERVEFPCEKEVTISAA